MWVQKEGMGCFEISLMTIEEAAEDERAQMHLSTCHGNHTFRAFPRPEPEVRNVQFRSVNSAPVHAY
jgi:hypothetical protein